MVSYKQRGQGLIETLISLLLLSGVILGAAFSLLNSEKLHQTSLSATRELLSQTYVEAKDKVRKGLYAR